jgi:hypothetical protein
MAPPARLVEVDDYLRKDWGVDVKGNRRVVVGIPDAAKPGEFRIDVHAFNFMSLSSFSDHPIGEPLQGQRMLWTEVSPVAAVKDSKGKGKLPKGVTLHPLLSVSEDRTGMWAPQDLFSLIRKVQSQEGGLVHPIQGDLTPPFDVAVVADRQERTSPRSGATQFTLEDIRDWAALVTQLSAGDGASFASPAKAVWLRLSPAAQDVLTGVKDKDDKTLSDGEKTTVLEALNALLDQPGLYSPKAPPPPAMPGGRPPQMPEGDWDKVALGWEAMALQAQAKGDGSDAPPAPLGKQEQRRFNRLVLEAAFEDVLVSSQDSKHAAVVVLGMAVSFFDFYMDQPVPRLNAEGGFSFDPAPKANADVIIGSVYFLAGKKEYIAAGPTILKPINVGKVEKWVLWGLCVIGLPGLVLLAGAGIWMLRRR